MKSLNFRISLYFRIIFLVSKNLFLASHYNSELRRYYYELGKMTNKALSEQQIIWNDLHVKNIVANIDTLNIRLQIIEEEVLKIKSLKK